MAVDQKFGETLVAEKVSKPRAPAHSGKDGGSDNENGTSLNAGGDLVVEVMKVEDQLKDQKAAGDVEKPTGEAEDHLKDQKAAGDEEKPGETEDQLKDQKAAGDEEKPAGEAGSEATREKETGGEAGGSSVSVGKSSSFKEESNLLSDLKEGEKKALKDLRSKLEDAIQANELLGFRENQNQDQDQGGGKPVNEEAEKKGKSVVEDDEQTREAKNKNISLWGVPLLPSKCDERTDVILLKFLRAREFRAEEAFRMLRKTLQWRKENGIDSVVEEDFGPDLVSRAWMDGADRDGHPVCYNVYGDLGDDEVCRRIFRTEEQRRQFLRWRFQLMEKGIRRLDFRPGGASSLLQINDLKNSPGPSRKELRLATKQAVDLLQDNYPEFVARNIFINVPFWYYAFNAVLSPFFTQRTKSKFVFARPSRVTETLLKYIAAEEIPHYYGGLRKEKDSEFSIADGVVEVPVRAGWTETIEIPAPEAGAVTVWDVTVVGWEVNYKEEFVPAEEGSYTVIVQRERRMGWQEGPLRNSFRNGEAGKIVITIQNGLFKRKRALYRFKTITPNGTPLKGGAPQA